MQQQNASQQTPTSSSNANGAGSTSGASNANPGTPPAKSAPAAPDSPATGSAQTPSAPATASTKNGSTVLAAGSDLSTLIVQAAAQAANAQAGAPTTPAPKTPAGPGDDSAPGNGDGKNSSSFNSTPDLAMLLALAQAAMLGTNTTPATTKSTGADSRATKDDPGAAKDGKTPAQPTAGAPDISTLLAQASILANAQQAAATTPAVGSGAGKESPLSGLGKAIAGSSAKEKKSVSTEGEGSFLQGSSTSSDSTSNPLSMLQSLLANGGESTGRQQVASDDKSKNAALSGLSGAAATTAGTANVEKGKTMNADFKFAGLEAMSGLATPAASTQQPTSDMHILLGSNNDFEDALKQVMHVAQLTQTAESRTPMRVEMEIQTPPGAIVNVYVSRQNDQWRAQLSTNDPQAMTWVQDKMNSLRQSTDLGVQVKWLPPQMEASSSGSGANFGWDRGGQGQSNYQQPDQQSQSNHQQRQNEPEFAGVGADEFSNTLASLGRAA